MSRKSKRSVYIVAGAHGGATHTTRRSARRLVEAGRARWLDENVVEIIATPRHDSQYVQHIELQIQLEAEWVQKMARNHAGWAIRDGLGLPNFVGVVADTRASKSKSRKDGR